MPSTDRHFQVGTPLPSPDETLSEWNVYVVNRRSTTMLPWRGNAGYLNMYIYAVTNRCITKNVYLIRHQERHCPVCACVSLSEVYLTHIENALNNHERGSKTARTVFLVAICRGRALNGKGKLVSNDFLSTFVDSINVFVCRLSGVYLCCNTTGEWSSENF